MQNFRVKYVRQVICDLSADQWELYTSSYPRLEIQTVADTLNNAFMQYFNVEKLPRDTLIVKMDKLQAEYAKYGANDTEPRRILWHLTEKAYNGEPD